MKCATGRIPDLRQSPSMAAGSGWEVFFLAVSGVAAALAGLIFVGLSINLDHILETPGLHLHGLEAVLLLVMTLALALSALVPVQTVGIFIGETALAILVLTAIAIASTRPMLAVRRQYAASFALKVASAIVVIGSLALSAITAGDRTTSFAWLAVAMILSIISASMKGWQLLVLIELDNPSRRR